MYSEPTAPASTTYVPTAADLRQANLHTDQHAQPFCTRRYVGILSSGNFLVLVPKPGFHQAAEYTPKGVQVAVHHISGSFELLESMAGRGRRQVLTASAS